MVTSSDVICDLSEKMSEVLSVDLLPSLPMPFAASRYVVLFSLAQKMASVRDNI